MHQEITIPELTDAIARLSALLGPRAGAVRPLDGGITNRNFCVTLGDSDYVVRLPGKDTNLLGINREAERLANKHAAALGLAPNVAAALEDPTCLVTRFVAGREMTAEELREPDAITEVGRGLRDFHDSGVELPTEFQVLEIARDYAEVARSRGGEPPQPFEDALVRAREIVHAVGDDPEHAPVPCHNDLLPANFLRGDEGIVIVDWEYAGMGDRFFDLANFSINHEFGQAGNEALLEAYFGALRDEDLRALLLMRFMSDFREAMWGVVQQGISELDFDFVAYASEHFGRLRRTAADPEFREALQSC